MKKRLIPCHQIIKTVLLFCLLSPVFVCSAGAQSTEQDLTTIILVRHAEKADDSNDPELSKDGYERTLKLSEMVEYVQFEAVYSTDFIRTRETVRPIAETNRLSIEGYDHRSPVEESEKWIDKHAGQTILVSGHSNSTPAFANAILGEEHFPGNFDESDYGNILIVTIGKNGERILLHLRY